MPKAITPAFLLEKEWHDSESDIEVVEIRYVCSGIDQAPDWFSNEETRVLVATGEGPLYDRRCAIELPCMESQQEYLLHYDYLVIRNGRQQTTCPVVDRIVSREVEYYDSKGCESAAWLQWSIDSISSANFTSLIPHEAADLSHSGRRFRGLVWGPAGATVQYVVRLQAEAAADDVTMERWDTNVGKGWRVVL